MKRTIKLIFLLIILFMLFFLFGCAMAYVFFGIINFDFDISHWHTEVKILYYIVATILGLFAGFVSILMAEDFLYFRNENSS